MFLLTCSDCSFSACLCLSSLNMNVRDGSGGDYISLSRLSGDTVDPALTLRPPSDTTSWALLDSLIVNGQANPAMHLQVRTEQCDVLLLRVCADGCAGVCVVRSTS